MAYNPMLPDWAQADPWAQPQSPGQTAYAGPDGAPVAPQPQAGPTPFPPPEWGVAAVQPSSPQGMMFPGGGAPAGPSSAAAPATPQASGLVDPYASPLIAPWSDKEIAAAGRVKGKDAAKAKASAELGIVPRTEQAPEPQQSPMDEIRQGQEALLLDKGRIEADAADRRSAMLTDAAYKGEDAAAEEQQRIEEGLAVRRDSLERFTAAAQKVSEMKEDPSRWWKEASTAKKVASFAGAAIAGFLNPTGENGVVALMERQIDKDLAAQRTDMANARFGVEAQRTALGEMTQIFGDERAAFSYLRGQKKEQLAMQLEAEGAKSQSELIRNNAMQGALALHESAIKDQQDAARWDAEHGLNVFQAQTSRKAVGVQAGQLALDRKRHEDNTALSWYEQMRAANQALTDNTRKAAEQAGLSGDVVIPGVDDGTGRGYIVGLDKNRTAKAAEKVGYEKQKTQVLYRMRKLVSRGAAQKGLTDGITGGSPEGKEFEALAVEYAKLDSVSKGQGALNNEEARAYGERVFGGGRSYLGTGTSEGQIDSLILSAEDAASSTLADATGQKGQYMYDYEKQTFVPKPPGFVRGTKFTGTPEEMEDLKTKALHYANPLGF